ncbi:unnamed protein product [Vitrella brassicaformis CCMP3155]|uniref:Uncharacterized protein n=1 Tax=Vitrella brassicaformis (strain CCMP3155) TaxID=1169540 RepID=A0A0G4GP57_VITBC|nr:unnamed protein product [Vitrella brassicaformis CCMP3155]|eukprot:CEM31960.1 unnamed protein product [Vitrella brassicaformis CCMP3155]
MQHTHQHPFTHIFVGRRTYFLLSLTDILRLRAVCRWLRELFRAAQLRQRLNHSLSTEAGLRPVVNGQAVQLLVFDDQQMGVADLLAAVCVTEAGGWEEMREAIALAAQCGYCQLPVRLTATDLHKFLNKTVYLATPRVLAHRMMVGRHIDFGTNGVTFQLFDHGKTLRAIRDEDGFEIEIDPRAGHYYQRHRQQHDPPVRSRIEYSHAEGWRLRAAADFASVSSFIKRTLFGHFNKTTHATTNSIRRVLDR